MSRIKLCGMFREEDVAAVNAAKPDYVGFIVHYPKSHRSISEEKLRSLCALVAPGIRKVGVFVSEPIDTVIRLLNEGVIDMAQLHGDEDHDYIRALRSATGKPVIKALLIGDAHFADEIQNNPADYLLLDSGRGSGVAFDLSRLPAVSRPFFLAGGVTPENIDTILKHANPFCIDVSSGIETDKKKDPQKIMEITKRVREYGCKGGVL